MIFNISNTLVIVIVSIVGTAVVLIIIVITVGTCLRYKKRKRKSDHVTVENGHEDVPLEVRQEDVVYDYIDPSTLRGGVTEGPIYEYPTHLDGINPLYEPLQTDENYENMPGKRVDAQYDYANI